jgi:ketosteroid isomerase-like protein
MSQKNVDVVLAAYEYLNSGDIDALIDLCDEDFSMDMSERVFNPDAYSGREDLHRFYDGVKSAWDIYRWEVTQTRAVDDVVVAFVYCRGQGREGGPWAEWNVAWLWRFRRGRVIWARFYRDPSRALEAAGLEA